MHDSIIRNSTTPISTSSIRSTVHRIVVSAGLLSAATGCGQGASDAAKALIETELGAEFDGGLTATCPDAVDVATGSSFECTAETQDGRIVAVTATITGENEIGVKTTNVVSRVQMATLEGALAGAI